MVKVAEGDRGIIESRQTRRAATTDRWYLWTIAVVGTVLAVYFYTNPDIWTMQAEWFYVLIFGGAAFLSVVAGAYRIYSRPTYSRPR
jgi:hypothetical protein